MTPDEIRHRLRVAQRDALGRFGETYTCHELQRQGYEVIERNARFASGEIDIIAREGGELVFVEVKTRRSGSFTPPEDAIGDERMSHLEGALIEYLEANDLLSEPYRIEVVAIEVNSSGKAARFDVIGDVGLR